MFRLNRNERSHWSRNGVHVLNLELVFMIGRNTQWNAVNGTEADALAPFTRDHSLAAAITTALLVPRYGVHWYCRRLSELLVVRIASAVGFGTHCPAIQEAKLLPEKSLMSLWRRSAIMLARK